MEHRDGCWKRKRRERITKPQKWSEGPENQCSPASSACASGEESEAQKGKAISLRSHSQIGGRPKFQLLLILLTISRLDDRWSMTYTRVGKVGSQLWVQKQSLFLPSYLLYYLTHTQLYTYFCHPCTHLPSLIGMGCNTGPSLLSAQRWVFCDVKFQGLMSSNKAL